MLQRRYFGRLPALAFSIVMVSSIAPVYAQFDRGPAEAKPWAELKLNPKTRVRLQFRNASINAILSLFERVSGVTLVKDPSLTGTLTLTSATAVPLNDAFNILSKTLSLKGYRLQREEGLLVIRKQAANTGARSAPAGGQAGGPMDGPGGAPQEPAVLRVYTIQYANASQLARTLNEVFGGMANQNGGTNIQPGGPGRGPGGGGPGGAPVGGIPGGGGGPTILPPPGGGGGNPPESARAQTFAQGGGRPQAAGGTVTFRASADDFSNSIAIYAPERIHSQVKDLIAKLDRQTEDAKRLKVYRLVHAGASDLVSVVQNVLNGAAPTGRGGATTQQTSGPAAMMRAASGGTAGAGQVVEDSRTNSLVVTATEANLATLDRIIPELDNAVESQGTAFIFPLRNAKSDDIASLLQQAFGQRQGAGTTGTTAGQNNARSNPTGNQAPTTRGGGGNGGLGGTNLNDLPLQVNDRGELLTSVGVSQTFGQGFLGGSSSGNQGRTNQATARNAQGQVVNTPELTGQVTVVSDPNTNSLIVVAMPEHAELVRRILDQLDKIPEQVMIEAIIVEAALDSSRKFGVEWKFASERLFKSNTGGTGQTDFGQTAATAVTGLQYTVTGANLNVFFNALKEDTSFHVLSTPRIFTSNNVQAEINISQSVPYVLSSSTDVNGNISYNYSFQDVGIVLTVTPRITSNGYVTMEVSQTANELQGYTSFNAPIVNQRQADTTVSVRDGDAIILGGIMRKTVTSSVKKVPLLGDLPLLGNLFKSTSRADSKTELMVFLRPRIVRNAEDAQKLRQQISPVAPGDGGPLP